MQTPAAPSRAGRTRVPASPRHPRPDRRGLRDIRRHHPRLRRTVAGLLAEQAPGLLRTLRAHDPDFVLLDGTLAECDRVGDSKADYSSKHKRHGVNVQVVTDQTGEILWLSLALPGRTHDLTAARTHKVLRICERQGVPILADMAYTEAGDWVTTAKRRPPGGELTPTERTKNRALSAARAPVERAMARLKSGRFSADPTSAPTA